MAGEVVGGGTVGEENDDVGRHVYGRERLLASRGARVGGFVLEQVVEVLPRHEYDDEHLPGALHLPLKHLDGRAAEALDEARPVIVYCYDTQ